jgi:hypothetical protein
MSEKKAIEVDEEEEKVLALFRRNKGLLLLT